MKSGHALVAGWSQVADGGMWNVQERIKVFLWEVAHGRLFTNEVRWKRNLVLNGDCEACVGELETVLHTLRECKEASELWYALLLSHLLSEFFSLSLGEWVIWNLEGKEMRGFTRNWSARMAICCWWI